MCLPGVWWEGRVGGSGPGPHPVFSLQLEQRGKLQRSVAKEVSGRGTSVSGWRDLGSAWVGGQMAQLGTQAAGSLLGNMVGTWTDRVRSGSGSLLALGLVPLWAGRWEGLVCMRVWVGVPSSPSCSDPALPAQIQAPAPADIRILRGHQLSVTCLVITPDDLAIFSAAKDCTIIKCECLGGRAAPGGHLGGLV